MSKMRPVVPLSERLFRAALTQAGLPQPEREVVFARPRRWRFDYAWPDSKTALEIEGGAFIRGRHTRGAGFVADLAKYSEAAVRGWCVLRVTPQQLAMPAIMALIARAVNRKAAA